MIKTKFDYPTKRKFVAYFWFVDWGCFSLGFHICITKPNIEIHLPFGFFRIGWDIFPIDKSFISSESLNTQ